MDTKLRLKIIEDLLKSGVGSELRALKAFKQRGWEASGATTFLDRDEGKTRELDLRAYVEREEPFLAKGKESAYGSWLTVAIAVAGEVKKTEKPWVVLKEDLAENQAVDAWNNVIVANNLPVPGHRLVEDIGKFSVLSEHRWRAAAIHECFKSPNNPSRWYSGAVSACKGAEYLETWYGWKVQAGSSFNAAENVFFMLVKPVLIIDGVLAGAELTDGEGIELFEVPVAPMEFEFKTQGYSRGRYMVDIVQLDHLPDYIGRLEKRLQHLYDRILKEIRAKLPQSEEP